MNSCLPPIQYLVAQAGETFNLKELLFEKGGLVMVPLGVLSVIAVFLIIYYLLTLRRNVVVSDRFMNKAESLILQRDVGGLLSLCDNHDRSISRITEKTMDFIAKNPEAPVDEVREVTQAEGTRQAGILNQKITYLSDIGTIAPMVGLLGTVIGMIKAFATIGSGQIPTVLQQKLASSVSEALITTASGLVIGITCLAFFSFFRGRVQRYISELEAAATHLMALIAVQMASPEKNQPASRLDAKG